MPASWFGGFRRALVIGAVAIGEPVSHDEVHDVCGRETLKCGRFRFPRAQLEFRLRAAPVVADCHV
jgi:hypothetical protein